MRTILLAVAMLALSGCGGSPASEPRGASSPSSPSGAALAAPTVVAHSSADAPEISRSSGTAGGIILLWPRIVGDRGAASDPDSRQIAARIQRRLSTIIGRALPGKPIDVRPEPERVCPRAGCAALAVGAVLSRSGGGCAVVAVVSDPGVSAGRLVAWAGNINLRHPTVPFRQPPEQEMSVEDYQSCGALDGDLGAHEGEVEAAVRKGGG
jgi:hypothetical protein